MSAPNRGCREFRRDLVVFYFKTSAPIGALEQWWDESYFKLTARIMSFPSSATNKVELLSITS